MHPQEHLVEALAGSAIVTLGIVSLCLNFGTIFSRERILLWFGLFAAPYGTSLVCRNILLPGWDGRAELELLVLARLTGLLSSIPAILLFREFYGAGWRLSTKWVIWIYVILLVGVWCLTIARDRPEALPSPGLALVILLPLELTLDRITGYRPPQIKGTPIIFAGLLVFFLTFSFDHLAHWGSGNTLVNTEPFGFLGLTFCLGYLVYRRVAANESEWLSMSNEMQAARRIQAAILPSRMPAIPGFSVSARYAPMTAVAGDFYGFPALEPGCLGLIVADVMGHGVPAALIASMVKVSVYSLAETHGAPVTIIGSLNKTLCKEAPGQFATAVYLSLNHATGSGRYCSAGHPPPLLWRRCTQQIEALNVAGLLLGVRPEEEFAEGEFRFDSGDRLLVYTDGLTEAENRWGVSFGDARLPFSLGRHRTLTADQFAGGLLEEVLDWSAKGEDAGQEDDITFVVVDLA